MRAAARRHPERSSLRLRKAGRQPPRGVVPTLRIRGDNRSTPVTAAAMPSPDAAGRPECHA